MVQATLMVLLGKDIPLEGQIIRVADEFDAIVSKRQYKSHIGITDTLKILVDESKPSGDLDVGKVNKKVVKALLKIVIFTDYFAKKIFKLLINNYSLNQML